ncbi:MAG: hypothetical protein FWH19_03400 [Treponema sp.]|nr:hypothetical protein [Treponema sp.]
MINGKAADISLDTEKTLGDVLYGIEQWVSNSGSRIQAVILDGKNIQGDDLAGVFGKEIKNIEKLDLAISSRRQMAAEALGELKEICGLYANAAFDERGKILDFWERSAAARYMASDMGDLYDFASRSLKGEGPAATELALCVDERLREITDTGEELDRTEVLVQNIAKRMEELPLDMQTGKDARAAETMQLFSTASEKLFRIFSVHVSEGLTLDDFAIDGLCGRTFFEEFNSALTELQSAYENRDTVLAGDISEYELAPRLLKFFQALKNITKTNFTVTSVS